MNGLQKLHSHVRLLIFLLCLSGVSFAQESYTVSQVQDSLKASYAGLTDYKVRAKLNVEMPKFRMPGKNVDIAYKRPDHVRVDVDGFAAVPKMGVSLLPEQLFAGLKNLSIAEPEAAAGGRVIILGTMKSDTLNNSDQRERNQMRLIIDTERWVISEIETIRDSSVISSATIAYEEYELGLLLPDEVIIEIHLPESMREQDEQTGIPDGMAEDSPMSELENMDTIQGTITIDFGRYRINTGLSDDFFDEEVGQ